MTELKTLEFKTLDVEPEAAEPIKIELGSTKYVARCPNDFEFTTLNSHLQDMTLGRAELDVRPILEAFFEPRDAVAIENACRGSRPKIRLIGDLLPALNALADHYKPYVEKRMTEVQKALSAPK